MSYIAANEILFVGRWAAGGFPARPANTPVTNTALRHRRAPQPETPHPAAFPGNESISVPLVPPAPGQRADQTARKLRLANPAGGHRTKTWRFNALCGTKAQRPHTPP